jgi:hypothetical protein
MCREVTMEAGWHGLMIVTTGREAQTHLICRAWNALAAAYAAWDGRRSKG